MTTPLNSLAVRLEQCLAVGAPQLGLKSITSVERFTSGLSSQSYGIHAETEDGPTRWVIRVEPEHGVIPPYDIKREFGLLQEVGKAGLPVAGALYLEEDANAIGGRFMLMSFVEGEIFSNRDPRLEADDALRAKIQSQFIETLAAIHSTPQSVLPNYSDGREATRAEVALCRRRLDKVELLPAPILRQTLDVLHERAPEVQRLGLLHGDYRLPNIKFHNDEIAGVLDWELARVGDPLSDLAFTQTIGQGICSVENELAEQYSALTGIELDPQKLQYYKLLEMAKGSIIGLGGAADLARGGSDLRLLSVANIALSGQSYLGVLEAQLLSMLEA